MAQGGKKIIITNELGVEIFKRTGTLDIEVNPNDKVVSVTEVNGRRYIIYCTNQDVITIERELEVIR